jgi:hypothetical protein
MMVDYNVDASQDLIKFIWAKLQSAGVMTSTDYVFESGATIIPIVPVQEIPEMANQLKDKPYIVYTLASDVGSESLWARQRDTIYFTIFSQDVRKIIAITNVMRDFLRRKDESARLINATAGLSGKYNFHCIYVMKTEVSGESTDEAGRMTGEVVIDYDYVRYLDSAGGYA